MFTALHFYICCYISYWRGNETVFLIARLQKAIELFAPDRLFKVVLVGNSSVGKTSLLRSFCEGRFHPSTTATVGEKKGSHILLMFQGQF